MAGFVKKGDLVLEPGCGPAILADCLPKGVKYKGFDTNDDFINFALRKQQGVYLGNALNADNYCKADVVVACDILHHLHPSDRKEFIQHCFKATKRAFIVCEPWGKDTTANGWIYSVKKRLVEWAEQDGTGDLKMEHYYSREQLVSQIKEGFGVIPRSVKRKTKKLGDDMVAVFVK